MDVIKTVKAGHVELEICQYADGRFGFDYYDENRRRIKCRWNDQAKAIDKAKEKVKIIADGKVEMLAASKDEWAVFQAFCAAGITLEELAEFKAWKATKTKTKTIADIRDELLKLKKDDADLDAVYVTNLAGPWELFCKSFGKRTIGEVTPSCIEEWLRDLKRSTRTRNNYRDALVQLFRFARQREYLPDQITAAEKVLRLKIKAKSDDIEIYTPEEMRAFLKFVKADFLPWVVIGGFAGVRTEELCPNKTSHKDPLRWEDIQWEEKQICVRAETSKVGRTRFPPISDNLLAWLDPYRDHSGPVLPCPVNTLYNEIKLMRTRMKKAKVTFTFKKNALRHSFGSYRNAIIRNIGQLSDEMGNSPFIAKRNYERPQPRYVADEWFSIMP